MRAALVITSTIAAAQVISFDVERVHDSHSPRVLSSDGIIPINVNYFAKALVYQANFTFGTPAVNAKMRLVTDTDWTMVTNTDCYRCPGALYSQAASSTSANGTLPPPVRLAANGSTVTDTVCIANPGRQAPGPCVPGFEFFQISSDV